MSWLNETNLTPGPPSSSSQTVKTAVGFTEEDWTAAELPCVRATFDFAAPNNEVGGEGNVYLRRRTADDWIRAQVKLKQGNMFDFTVKQNSGVDLSQDPDEPVIPWTQVKENTPSPVGTAVVRAIEEDGSGGWFVAGIFDELIDESGTTITTHPYVIHINANGSFDSTFRVSPDAPVYSMVRDGTTLFIGGAFTSINTHASTINHLRVASVSTTTGTDNAPAVYDIGNGIVYSMAYDDVVEPSVGSGDDALYIGGSFTQVNSASKHNAAKIQLDGASIVYDTWDMNHPGQVFSIAFDSHNGFLWVGGSHGNPGDNRGLTAHRYQDGLRQSDRVQLLKVDEVAQGSCYALYYDVATKTLYVGGEFAKVKPLSGSTVTRNNAMAVDVFTAFAPILDWNPNVNDIVRALQVSGGSTENVMLGGDFTQIGSTSRNYTGEVTVSEATVLSWNANLDEAVYALGYYTSGMFRLVGGAFTTASASPRNYLANYADIDTSGLDEVVEVLEYPMPSSKKLTVLMHIECGEILKTWLMESDSGKVLSYSEHPAKWDDSETARVETGPAGKLGPKIETALLSETSSIACAAEDGTYAACDGPTTINHFTTAHMAEAYPEIIHDVTYTGPRGWADGVAGLNPPYQRPARWWHELIEPNETPSGGSIFLADLTIAGDNTLDDWQFSNPWCLGIVDVRGHETGFLNKDDDPTSARWANVLMAGKITTVGSKVLISGFSVRMDYKKNAIAIGMSTDCGVHKTSAQRAFNTDAPGSRDIIYPGTFAPTFLDWTPVSNLDQWTGGISLAIDMDCANLLTVDVWGTNGTPDTAKIASLSVTIDPVHAGGPLNLALDGGTYWGMFTYAEGKNSTALNDDISEIKWNELTADKGVACS